MMKYILPFASIFLSFSSAHAGQVRCFESMTATSFAGVGAFDLVIDNVPPSFANNEYTNLEIGNAHIRVNAALTQSGNLEGSGTGGLGMEGGKVLIAIRESTTRHLIQI